MMFYIVSQYVHSVLKLMLVLVV
ncbi:unnamed protein product [Debaryomyces tyrocola]|nr:unnamed protein product [Debaryomyces tyrocola]